MGNWSELRSLAKNGWKSTSATCLPSIILRQLVDPFKINSTAVGPGSAAG